MTKNKTAINKGYVLAIDEFQNLLLKVKCELDFLNPHQLAHPNFDIYFYTQM